MSVTLGDCLSAAERLFAAAEADRLPVRDYAEFTVQTRRLVAVLGRYLNSFAAADPAGQGRPGWEQAAATIRAELHAAGGYLDRVLPPAEHPLRAADAPADPVAARYARAVDALVAGDDLLRTHTSLDSAGFLVPRSDWAQLLTAEPVAVALVGEMTGWARRAERMVDRVILSPSPAQRMSWSVLAAARDRLAAATRADSRARPASMDTGVRRDLLRAIPAAAVPERIIPSGDESDDRLRSGIVVSARRLRAAAFTTAQEQGSSPLLSGLAWRQVASASAIICDLAAQILQALACRQPGPPAGIPAIRPPDTVSCFLTAREAWRHVARMWQAMSTDTASPVSRTTTDATDMAVRLGRLLTGNPGWTPTGRHAKATVPRAAGLLAPEGRTLAAIIGAVHEAADAITRMASADLAALDGVRRAGRLYMRARTLGDMAAGYEFAPAPADRVHMLKNGYYLCADTSWRAASALDGLALETNAPSKPLALIRSVVPNASNPPEPETGFILDTDFFASQLPLFSRPRGARGRRRQDIDPDAVIRAYEDERLTLEECGKRFSTSPGVVKRIIQDHGHRTRTVSEAWRMKIGRERQQPQPAPPVSRSGPDEKAALHEKLQRLGVEDPGLLERAAMVDRAAADVLRTATKHLDVSPSRLDPGNRHRSPAELASKDDPRDPGAAVTQEAAPGDARQGARQPRQPTPNAQRAHRRRV